MKRLIGAILLSAGLISLVENISDEDKKKNLEYQIWVLPCDCAEEHTHGELINGFTRMQDCHDGYFTVFEDYILTLPKGVLPTKEDYNRLTKRTKSQNIKTI